MPTNDETLYRWKVAKGFLQEARQDIGLERWRSCVSNSQLAVELAAKTALALLGPVGRTRAPAALLYQALDEQRFSPAIRSKVQRIAECARLLGPAVHVKSDYGDEIARKTPWELFDQSAAQQALGLAEEAVRWAEEII